MRDERSVVLAAVRAAAHACRQVQAHMVPSTSMEKADRSPVTVADFASQAIICRHLAAADPATAIVAEESSAALREPAGQHLLDQVVRHVQADAPGATPDEVLGWIDRGGGEPGRRFWTLDPIDGTKGFLRRGQYAIALALIEDGEVVLGALGCPDLAVDPTHPEAGCGLLALARRGQGAWAHAIDDVDRPPAPMRTASGIELSTVRFVESVESGHANQEAHQRIASRLGILRPALRLDSQVKYAAVARGEASIYLRLPSPATPDYRERIWDHAAGACVVEEAGGTVTDAGGRTLDFRQGKRLAANQGVVVSSGPIHAALIQACVEVAAAA